MQVKIVVLDFMKMSNGPINDQRDCSADSARYQSLMGHGQKVEGVDSKLSGKMWTGDAVILRLRGGGASKLRMQARKRKFDKLKLEDHNSNQRSASGLEGGEPIRPSQSLHLDEVLSKPESRVALKMAPELKGTNEKTNGIDQSAQQPPLKKASRFIVFIGSFPIELGLLETDDLTRRELTIHCHSRFHKETLYEGKAKLYSSLYVKGYGQIQGVCVYRV